MYLNTNCQSSEINMLRLRIFPPKERKRKRRTYADNASLQISKVQNTTAPNRERCHPIFCRPYKKISRISSEQDISVSNLMPPSNKNWFNLRTRDPNRNWDKCMTQHRRASSSGQDSAVRLHLKDKTHSFEIKNVHILDRGVKGPIYVKQERSTLNNVGGLLFGLPNTYNGALNLLPTWIHNHSYLDYQNQVNSLQ